MPSWIKGYRPRERVEGRAWCRNYGEGKVGSRRVGREKVGGKDGGEKVGRGM